MKILEIEDYCRDIYCIPLDKITYVEKHNQYSQYSSHDRDYEIRIGIVNYERPVIKKFDTEDLLDIYFGDLIRFLKDN